MAFGKLYTATVSFPPYTPSLCSRSTLTLFSPRQANPRSTAILAVAKANNLDLEVVETNTSKPPAGYTKYNKLGKIPTFVGSDGYVLSECVAIAIYGR
jgi:glutathione S-transferase